MQRPERKYTSCNDTRHGGTAQHTTQYYTRLGTSNYQTWLRAETYPAKIKSLHYAVLKTNTEWQAKKYPSHALK